MARLARAVGARRVIEPRLTGGFAYAVPPAVVRGAEARALPPEVLIAAAGTRSDVAARDDAAGRSARAAADLLLGNSAQAIQGLETAVAARPTAARYSNLAAAYLVHARSSGDTADIGRALAAADHALALNGRLPEAYFNRALAVEASGDASAAEAAWRAYLAVDPDSEWAREARAHLSRP
jgi:tetratricopeptide (TPR) repeat protein